MNSSEYSAIVQCEETLKSVLSQNPALAADCIAKRAKCLSPIDQLDAYDTDLSAYTRSCNLVEVVKKRVQYSNNPRYLFEELLKALKDCGNWTDHVIRLLRMSRNNDKQKLREAKFNYLLGRRDTPSTETYKNTEPLTDFDFDLVQDSPQADKHEMFRVLKDPYEHSNFRGVKDPSQRRTGHVLQRPILVVDTDDDSCGGFWCGTAVLCGLVMLFGALMVAIFIYRGPEYFANKVIIEDFFFDTSHIGVDDYEENMEGLYIQRGNMKISVAKSEQSSVHETPHPSSPSQVSHHSPPPYTKLSSNPILDEMVTLPELINFRTADGKMINIPLQIGVNYKLFGIVLLEDSTGNQVDNIRLKYGEVPVDINTGILTEWLIGKSTKPGTWQVLIQVLQDINSITLAEDIEDGLLQRYKRTEL